MKNYGLYIKVGIIRENDYKKVLFPYVTLRREDVSAISYVAAECGSDAVERFIQDGWVKRIDSVGIIRHFEDDSVREWCGDISFTDKIGESLMMC